MESSSPLPLHLSHVQKLRATINRTYILLHILALLAIFNYRVSFFVNKNNPIYQNIPYIPWLIIFTAELIFSIMWLLKQPIYWRPITRTAFPERLPKDEALPGVDVFICTADPKREPTWDVMNTVVSAMGLDYPKLSVYLSDDGGACVTLMGLKQAWVFATWWLPFRSKYGIKTTCPRVYFEEEVDVGDQSNDFIHDKNIIKEKYEAFKQQLLRGKLASHEVGAADCKTSSTDHPAQIEVINASSTKNDNELINPQYGEIPQLVYVAREKRPNYPHNFKAGALNVLLRASSMLSNSPYILVLDCDMYCNDSISARQAMCFFLDPKISSSLGWVQFPQHFHNTYADDIYNSPMAIIFQILWHGADGLQGPVISGTNFYIKREALYGINNLNDGNDLRDMKEVLGDSNEFIKSYKQICKPIDHENKELSSVFVQEAAYLASCTYEKNTKWGEKVGFRYGSVVEDAMTGFALQSEGWTSVYLNPSRTQFLGSGTTNLDDTLIQGVRWVTGLLDIGASHNSPFLYKQSRMGILHKMSSSWVLFFPLDFMPVYCFAIIPQLGFFYGVQLYPMVSDPFVVAFAFVFTVSRLFKLYEFLSIGGSIKSWYNDQVFWMVKAVTSYVYGTLEFTMSKLGLREASFIPTNKGGDDDQIKCHIMGKYDFRTSSLFLIPLGALVIFNLICFIGGLVRMIIASDLDAMFAQLMFSLYVFVMSFPIIEAMLLRKDKGRFPTYATLISSVISFVILILGFFILY